MIYIINDCRKVISCRSGDDNFLSARIDMSLSSVSYTHLLALYNKKGLMGLIFYFTESASDEEDKMNNTNVSIFKDLQDLSESLDYRSYDRSRCV